MSEHIKILSSVLILIICIYMITSVYMKKRNNHSPITKYLLAQLWVLFGINTGFLLLKYTGVNIISGGRIKDNLELSTLFFQVSLIGLGFYFKSLMLIFTHLVGLIPNRVTTHTLNGFIVLIILSVLVAIGIPGSQIGREIFYSQAIIAILIFTSEPIVFLSALLFIRKSISKNKRLVLFLWLFLLKYILIGIVLSLFSLLSDNRIIESLGYSLVILIYMVPPYLWLMWFLKESLKAAEITTLNDLLHNLSGKYNLTPREVEIISFIMEGLSNKEIEHKLSISYSTVKNHLYNIYRKFGIYSRLELSTFVNRHLSDN